MAIALHGGGELPAIPNELLQDAMALYRAAQHEIALDADRLSGENALQYLREKARSPRDHFKRHEDFIQAYLEIFPLEFGNRAKERRQFPASERLKEETRRYLLRVFDLRNRGIPKAKLDDFLDLREEMRASQKAVERQRKKVSK